jgi:hypothetical protein
MVIMVVEVAQERMEPTAHLAETVAVVMAKVEMHQTMEP